MHTPLITEDPAQAREQLAAYNRQLTRRDDPEYRVIAAGYAQLAAGRPLLNLRECFLTVPLDEKGRPRLAIARADRRTVTLQATSSNRMLFDTRKNHASNHTLVIEVAVPPFQGRRTGWCSRSFALVPLIPAAVRAEIPRGTTDAMCHILWEVEEKTSPGRGQSSTVLCRALLKYLGGELWVVLAEWWSDRPLGAQADRDPYRDLTELERAVMVGRALRPGAKKAENT